MTTRDRFLAKVAAEIGSPGKSRIQEYHRSAIGTSYGGFKEYEWCGLFCLWGLHEVSLATLVLWRLGGGFCEEQRLPRVKAPEPGDIAYFHLPFQHHAVVESARNGILVTIDGNQAGDTVQRKTRSSGAASVFYSIAPFLVPELDGVIRPVDGIVTRPTRATLRQGSSGADVSELQRLLNKYFAVDRSPPVPLDADGNFGPLTAARLAVFQQRQGLTADSVCGRLTWRALDHV